jgi:subtilisin family serine protease
MQDRGPTQSPRHGRPHRLSLVVVAVVAAFSLLAPVLPALATGAPTSAGDPAHVVRAATLAANADGGSVRVLLELDAEVAPESVLSPAGVRIQRARIARTAAQLAREMRDVGVRVTRDFATVPFVAAEVPTDALDDLLASGLVADVTIDHEYRPALATSTQLVQADRMWTSGLTGRGSAIAVLDTGVDRSHPFIRDRLVAEACFSASDGAVRSLCPNGAARQVGPGSARACTGSDGCFHGTHVAGIAVGRGTSSFGVAPLAELIAVQVFARRRDGGGDVTSSSSLLAALEHVYSLRDSYDIAAVNLSVSGLKPNGQPYTTTCDTEDAALQTMVAQLRTAGIATIAATGNEGLTGGIGRPACLSSVIAVGSADAAGVSGYSNNHPTMTDLLAPGEAIRSSVPDGGYGRAGGTSMAAPHVAGAFALLREQRPTASVATLLADLKATGLPVSDVRDGAAYQRPLIRIHAAAGTPPPFTAPTACAGRLVPDAGFADVVSRIHRPAIDCTAWYGIALGSRPGVYRPAGTVTRAQMATFLARTIEAAGGELPAGEGRFDDLAGSVHTNSIERLAAAGVVQGAATGRYDPEAAVTRAQMGSFLARTFAFVDGQDLPVPAAPFRDIEGNVHAENIARIAGAGFAQGTGPTTYAPANPVRREQMASFLTRMLERFAGDGRITPPTI